MQRKLLIILTIIVIIGGFFLLKVNRKSTTPTSHVIKGVNGTSPSNLTISPQIPKDKVLVDSATLSKDGFLVVREMDDNQLSQVVEMSKPLKKGINKNITIPLSRDEISGKQLIVMIYEDYADDQVFNDLDMPVLDSNGFMIARYVNTGKSLPSSITEGEGSNMSMNMPGMKTMAKVRYTDKGFVPNKVEVPAGSMVEFINASSKDMWVASVPHPQHTKLPTFDQFRAYKKGAIYRYVFQKKGSWEYHDHISPSLGGVVIAN